MQVLRRVSLRTGLADYDPPAGEMRLSTWCFCTPSEVFKSKKYSILGHVETIGNPNFSVLMNFNWNPTHAHSLSTAYGSFLAELGSCDRDCVAHKV